MLIKKPPPLPTPAAGDRLRPAEPGTMRAFLCAGLVLLLAAPAAARGNLHVLIGTDVSPQAQTTMSSYLWSRLVEQWVGEKAIPFDGRPTIDDCKRARALFMLYAPFDLRPKLPGGMLALNDRVAALTHVTIVNCRTNATIFDQIIGLASSPVTSTNPADVWESAIAQTLRTHPIAFTVLPRIERITPPFVLIAGGKGLALGQTLRIYATADGTLREPPVILTVTAVYAKAVEARYDAADTRNKVEMGDLVEPYAAVAH